MPCAIFGNVIWLRTEIACTLFQTATFVSLNFPQIRQVRWFNIQSSFPKLRNIGYKCCVYMRCSVLNLRRKTNGRIRCHSPHIALSHDEARFEPRYTCASKIWITAKSWISLTNMNHTEQFSTDISGLRISFCIPGGSKHGRRFQHMYLHCFRVAKKVS